MTTQDLINTLRQGKPMTDKLMREIVRELEDLKKLKEAVRPVVEYYKWLAVTEEDAFEHGEIIIGSSFQGVTKEQLDALAALVGEEWR